MTRRYGTSDRVICVPGKAYNSELRLQKPPVPVVAEEEVVVPASCPFIKYEQMEYLVAAPVIFNRLVPGDQQAIPDVVFLGSPPTSKWTPVQVTPPGTGVYWRRLASDRNKNIVALGGRVVVGPFGVYELRDVAVSTDGGLTWNHIVQEGDGTIAAPAWFAHVTPLKCGGFAVTSNSDIGAIGVLQATDTSLTMVSPGNYSATSQNLFNTRAVQSLDTSNLVALTSVPFVSGTGFLYAVAFSEDYGLTWSDWEPKETVIEFPDQGEYTAEPKGAFCIRDRVFVFGDVNFYSDDLFETIHIIQAGTHQFNAYHGGRYDNMDQNDAGAPLDWDSGDGFSYWDYFPYIHFMNESVQTDEECILVRDVFFETHMFTYDRWDWIGYDDIISWGYPTDMVYSAHHGVIRTGTGEQSSISHDGAHFGQWSHWDDNLGPPLELRHIQNFAVCGTNDKAFYESLLGYRIGF